MDAKEKPHKSGAAGPWNKGKLVGQNAPLRLGEIWATRVWLELLGSVRGSRAVQSGHRQQLRGCDLVQLKVQDIYQGGWDGGRAIVMQQKTKQPVQFELSKGTRLSLANWPHQCGLQNGDFLYPSRVRNSPQLSTRQHARIVHRWVDEIGLDPSAYGTHTMRRTKPTLIYRRTKN